MSFLSPFMSDTLEQAASLLGTGMPSVRLLLGSLSVAIVCPFSSQITAFSTFLMGDVIETCHSS